MGLHHRRTDGRVLRGIEAREHLHLHKRYLNGDKIKMHVPEGFEQKAQVDNVQTAVSVVYVTLPQTFSGNAVYSTMGADGSASQASATAPAASATSSVNDAEASYNSAKSAAQAAATSTSVSSATVVAQPSSTAAQSHWPSFAAISSTAAAAVTASTAGDAATVVGGTPIQATRSASASATAGAISQSSSGLSGGAKAGLAFGMIAAIALAFGLIFFCWRRKKNSQQHEELDEKHASFADVGARRAESGAGNRSSTMTEKVPSSIRSSRTASTAPRLSLRPVTQFLPNLGENRKSSGNALDVAATGAATSEKPKSAWERRPAHGEQDPFADAPVLSEKQAQPESPPSNPFDEPEGKKSGDSQGKHSPKASWEGSEPPTPKSTKFGTAAAVSVAAAGAARDVAPPRGPNNVHRVQLDFKPSMDDELELRSGQLVRMLHEYDDGWALCIRMDRSQQGVAPRTCLSKLPVKPRPQGPPPQGGRPGNAPGARRPSNPPAPNGAMYPRPLTPTQANGSPSPTESNGEASTSAGGVPARKPVPGQAM